jgi:peptidyl-prolyl cis-trans isomerase D
VKDEEALKKLKLKERVLNDLINERAALVIASSEGITVSDSEVVDAIRNEPVFQKDGRFDSATYERILKASRLSPKEYETMRTQELTLAKVKRLVGESAELSENEIKSLESMKEQKDQMKEFMLANKQENVLDIYLEDIRPTLDIKINEQLYNEYVIEK